MIIKFDPQNPLTVETFDGQVLFQWQPKTKTELTEKYFSKLNKLIEVFNNDKVDSKL